MARLAAFATALGLALAVSGASTAGSISPRDLIVVDRGNGTLVDVNPTTGASTVIASGFSNPQGVAVNAQGMIFVSDIGTSTIDMVDPATGTVTTFSGSGVGSGPTLNRPFQMAFSGGTLYVADGQTPDGNSTDVIAIDAAGNRTIVAGNNGSSNDLFKASLAGLAIDKQGSIFASSPAGGTVYHVSSGTATPLSASVLAPQGLAIALNGQVLAVNGSPSAPGIWSIDPTNGNAVVLADNSGIGTGPAFGVLRGITVAPDGTIYATDVASNETFMVNPLNGDRSVVSGNGVGGTTFGALTYGITVYPSISPPVPEPSSGVLLALGAAGLILARWRTRRRSA